MPKLVKILAHILFWGLCAWLILSSFSITTQEVENINGQEHVRIVRSGRMMYLLGYLLLLVIGFFYLNYWYWKKNLAILRKLAILLGSCVLVYVSYQLGLLLIFKGLVLRPPNALVIGITLFFLAISSTLASIELLYRHEIRKKAAEIEKRQQEMQVLRNQLNPHFLFNALNNLLGMVNASQNPRLNMAISTLSSVLRYSVYESEKSRVSLNRELEVIRDFVEIYKLRFEDDELRFEEKIQADSLDAEIEPGILLPLIENAVKYGVLPEQEGYIKLGVSVDEQSIKVEIRNRILREQQSVHTGGLGLQLTRKRLELSYPDNHLFLAQEENDEFVVQLIIPKS